MIKNLIIIVLFIALILTIVFEEKEATAAVECVKEPYEQNQMVDGCVMQKASGRWIRTCG